MSTAANKPPWVPPRIKAAPEIRQVYWCDYWKDARLPSLCCSTVLTLAKNVAPG